MVEGGAERHNRLVNEAIEKLRADVVREKQEPHTKRSDDPVKQELVDDAIAQLKERVRREKGIRSIPTEEKRPGIVARVGNKLDAREYRAETARIVREKLKKRDEERVTKKAEAAAKREAKKAAPKELSTREWIRRKNADAERANAEKWQKVNEEADKIWARIDAEEAQNKALEDAPKRIIPLAPDVIDRTKKPAEDEMIGRLRDALIAGDEANIRDRTKERYVRGRGATAEQAELLREQIKSRFQRGRMRRQGESSRDWVEEAPKNSSDTAQDPALRNIIGRAIREAEQGDDPRDPEHARGRKSNAMIAGETAHEARPRRRSTSGGVYRLPEDSPAYMYPEGHPKRKEAGSTLQEHQNPETENESHRALETTPRSYPELGNESEKGDFTWQPSKEVAGAEPTDAEIRHFLNWISGYSGGDPREKNIIGRWIDRMGRPRDAESLKEALDGDFGWLVHWKMAPRRDRVIRAEAAKRALEEAWIKKGSWWETRLLNPNEQEEVKARAEEIERSLLAEQSRIEKLPLLERWGEKFIKSISRWANGA